MVVPHRERRDEHAPQPHARAFHRERAHTQTHLRREHTHSLEYFVIDLLQLARRSKMEDARDRKRRKHHDDEDRDRKRHHHHKKDRDKGKKHKSDHHEKRRSDRERAEKQPPTHSDIDPISEDDYFKRSAEFRDWLREDRGRYFEDLTSEDARKQFKKFVSKWNAGELRSTIYKQNGTEQTASSRTKHVWGFASKLSDADQYAIDRAIGNVARGNEGS